MAVTPKAPTVLAPAEPSTEMIVDEVTAETPSLEVTEAPAEGQAGEAPAAEVAPAVVVDTTGMTRDEIANRVPSNWVITELEDGSLDCRNSVTGSTYAGDMDGLNAILRGK